MRRRHFDWLILTTIFIAASGILYLYFWFFNPLKLEIVYQNWDGPVYTAIGKSLYRPEILEKLAYAQFKQPQDFASSFPLYPVLIRLFSAIGYFRATILVSLLTSLAAIIAFYEIVRRNKLSRHPLLLSTVFIFLPPRWFITTHIGSSEPLFMLLVILSMIFFWQGKYFKSGLALALAQLARSQAILFFAGYGLVFLFRFIRDQEGSRTHKLKKYARQFAPYFLAPTALFLVFFYFYLQFGDFWAFFSAIGKWPVRATFPFEVFASYPHQLVPTFWIENHFWIYFVDILGILILIKKRLYLPATLAGVYFLPLLFLIHIDLARYNLPIIPFLLVAFEKKIGTKLFLIALALMIPALYVYAIEFMFWNR